MRGLALLLTCCAGCDLLFDVHHLEGRPADAMTDATAPIDHSPCSLISMLADDFARDDLAVQWPASYADTGDAVTVEAGRAKLALVLPGTTAALDSGRYYDLREQTLSLVVSEEGPFDTTDAITVALSSEQQGWVASARIVMGSLTFKLEEPGGSTTVGSTALVTSTPFHLRFSSIHDMLGLEISTDGSVYTMVGQPISAPDLTFVRVQVAATRGATSGTFSTFIDDVNDGSAGGHACPVGLLQDDFTDAKLGSQWARTYATGTGASYSIDQGTVLVKTGVTDSYISVEPSAFYDLTGSSFTVEISQMLRLESDESVDLIATTQLGDVARFDQTNGRLTGASHVDMTNAVPFDTPYSATTMKYWRISHDAVGHQMVWSTSPDGITFQPQGMAPELRGLDRVDLAIAVASQSPVADQARFDRVNL